MEGGELVDKARPAGDAICRRPSGRSACMDNLEALALDELDR